MISPVRFRTYAKVNLFLQVLGLRSDGYHEIETVFHGISLGDDLVVTPTDTGTVEIEMGLAEGLDGILPAPADNILNAVIERLVGRGAHHEGLKIEIVKRIPLGAGLGGGSANAGGAFVVLNEMLKVGLERSDLVALAGGVGSDVPYCIEGGTALATGRGEKLTQLVAPTRLWFVLGMSRVPLSTEDVYVQWDEMGREGERVSVSMALALGAGDVGEIAASLHNDLETAAFSLRPELPRKKDALLAAGAAGVLLSGSGPTLFGLCRSEADAAGVARRVEEEFDRVAVVHSEPHCLERLPSPE